MMWRLNKELLSVLKKTIFFFAVVVTTWPVLAQSSNADQATQPAYTALSAALPLNKASAATNVIKTAQRRTASQEFSAGSNWRTLTEMQKKALAPLASQWDRLSEGQKRKWFAIAQNYPGLPAQDQAKMHARMTDWVALSPKQRAQARINFGKTAELSGLLTTETKKEKWAAYQSLPDIEKQKLADKAHSKTMGAAPANRPVAQEKITDIKALKLNQAKPVQSNTLGKKPGTLTSVTAQPASVAASSINTSASTAPLTVP